MLRAYCAVLLILEFSDDFFVGIGDINATYLPKLPDPLGGPVPRNPPPTSSRGASGDSATPTLASSSLTTSPAPSASETDVTKAEVESSLVAEAQAKAIVTQLEDRPLAKMQEALEKEESTEGVEASPSQANGAANGTGGGHLVRKALLRDDDWDLERVGGVSPLSALLEL